MRSNSGVTHRQPLFLRAQGAAVWMVSWSVVKFFFYLSLPWLFGRVVKRITQKSAETPKKPIAHKTYEKWTVLFGVVYAAFQIFYALYVDQRHNFFQTLKIDSVDVPGYMLRFQFQKYCEEQASGPKKKAFERMLQCRAESKCGPLELSPCTEVRALEREYVRLARLAEELRSVPQRKRYMRHGDDAFLRCFFCTEEGDFALYNACTIAASYVGFLFVQKVLTSFVQGKAGWFRFACIFAACLLLHEAYFYASSGHAIALYDWLFVGSRVFAPKMTKLCVVRRLLFAVGTLIVAAFDNGIANIADRIDAINAALEKTLQRSHLLRMHKIAVNQDGDLRRFAAEVTNSREKVRESVYRDEDFAKYKTAILANVPRDLEEFTRSIDRNVDDLLALQEQSRPQPSE